MTGSGYNDDGKCIALGKENLKDLEYLAFLGMINNEAHLEKTRDKWEYYGDSIDIAFLSLAKKVKVECTKEIVKRISYESENQYSAVFYKDNNKLYCTVKGSLERILSFADDNEDIRKQNELYTMKGYRVIAIASGIVENEEIKNVNKLKIDGLVAFIDPIRNSVKKSIKECQKAGIKVTMVTGDHPLTALTIGKELGICSNNNEVATGKDIEEVLKKGKEEFTNYVKFIKVFARVTPTQKLEIVEALKRNGEFVAVTGDGVNDAPALKSANIGIAMGSGTDVAKETASMIIIDDSFSSVVKGIMEGRVAYNNIRKITLFLLSCGLAEVAFFMLSLIFNYEMPLVAIQLLWINIITDGLQDVALSFEKAFDGIMEKKPRSTKESLFSKDLMIEVLLIGGTISIVVFGFWKVLMDKKVDIILARSMIMMLMVFIQNFNVLNCRSEKKSIINKNFFSNKFVILTIIGAILLQIVVSEWSVTAAFLQIVPLKWKEVLVLLGLSLIIIIVDEIYKLMINYGRNK